MDFFNEFKSEYAVFIVRLIAGVLFFTQGFDKVVRLGLSQTGEAAVYALRNTKLSPFLIKLVTGITALLEFTGGFLLILGFLTVPACYMLAACLVPVTIAMSLREPMWNLQFVWTRLLLIIFLLIVPESVHTISVDHLIELFAK